jgi:hypothetical protein
MNLKLRMRVALLAILVVVLPGFGGVLHGASSGAGLQTKQEAAGPSIDAVVYTNTKYGFRFSLPNGWKGYSIITEQWEATDAQKGVVERGGIVCIRHPDWTKENPRQDIPIMVFTLTQWDSAEKSNLYVSESAMSFHELGRNRKYAFAVSNRYNEVDVPGREEVDKILQHEPLHPLWSK